MAKNRAFGSRLSLLPARSAGKRSFPRVTIDLWTNLNGQSRPAVLLRALVEGLVGRAGRAGAAGDGLRSVQERLPLAPAAPQITRLARKLKLTHMTVRWDRTQSPGCRQARRHLLRRGTV
jgi:hypothetical protein